MSFINNLLTKFFGNKSDRDIKEIMPYVEKTKTEYEKLQNLSNDQLRDKTKELQQRINEFIQKENQEIAELKLKLDSDALEIDQREEIYDAIDKIEKQIDDKIEDVLTQILPEAFAVIKETARRFKENEYVEVTATDFDKNIAAKRSSVEIEGSNARWYNKWMAGGNEITWDMVHYDVQLIGGVALHNGKIAEMATGEGKTLVATLPVFLNALTHRGVHVVTVNDYLAKRDAEWMGTLYEFHGLSVDCIDKHQPNSDDRRKAYQSDITFGTNNEFGFDYLRDNMAISPDDLVQRRHNYAIVDEVDSVLIDDARTPLIISGPVPKGENQLFDELKPKVLKLHSAQKNLVSQLLSDAKKLIAEGKEEDGGLLLLRANKGLPKNKAIIKYLNEPGMKVLLQKTENFYMQENNKNMHKVTDDLFFVIEEKQNAVELTDKGIDLISTDAEDHSFFVLPDVGAEIAELEKKSVSLEERVHLKDQLIQDYAIKSERVHTINQLLKAYAMFEIDVEYVVIENKVKIVDEQTGRIMEGRRYSDGLHQAIEAKENVKVEAATQTFATITLQNYFRMYHKLAGMTGTAETEAGEFWDIYKLDVVVIPTNRPITRKDHEDLVYKTTREKYNAVIDETVSLVNKGRPVLVGTTSVEVSELLSRMLKMKGIRHNVLNAKLHQREAEIVAEAGKPGTVTIATNMAGRGTDIKLTEEVKKAGGLAILGTERHESRRVDRQLRGRSGRQGDPGSSQFFVALDDNLMRLFGSDRIAGLMDRLGLKEGEVIQHSMISKSIERAQKKVEENNFGIRKRLLEYDDVMNNQREVIYKRRRHALFGDRLKVDIVNNMMDVCENLLMEYQSNQDYEGLQLEAYRILSVELPFDIDTFRKEDAGPLSEQLYRTVLEAYKRKSKSIQERVFPVVKNVYERQGQIYDNIVIPITDGHKTYNIVTNLKKAYESEGKDLVKSIEKSISLLTIDEAWKEHLREMDDLKQSVQNATYEQKDPLLIYKFESFELFKTMVEKVSKDVVSILMKGNIPVQDPEQVKQAEQRRKLDMSKFNTSRSESGSPEEEKKAVQPVRVEKKVGRNDPCPCGSGKKFKQCHGINAE
ncbi:MAG TPA: preprotein translocase subunit SecA [Marinilabiliales bacterium]|nr:MAG: preprotein translocase subunit SecA [Bacteroidetes bacterium GWA2_40_14]OFX63403.1 MAG: preprotein translocase subunit SecA [Bacteroidetes bacterium GWC2_40_13]OFX74649.1 MAG: preprotein translocase subunit SecA [Bacteroidetes bacterium GWD2_40_43]OFX93725.1 MAG: preprotein translocase subunit SecA [Bacteroidetes bacterium GWE2_40_63]OFY18530.1 MAG: preprotein translocase subunit SecA [Bacteroidetes bacterium GWF2_40_13]OFZ32081.1 MAG: preprotein translocase subunit SecA [Bacteroidetes